MNDNLNQGLGLMLLRLGVQWLGVGLTAAGAFTEGEWQVIAGPLIALGGVALSVFANRARNKAAQS